MAATGRDEVDGIVAAWHRERPDLDLAPMHVMSRVSRLADRLAETRSAAFERYELAPWEFDVLAALRRSGAPYELSPTELARDTHVTSGTMTNRITRLAARGLVSRDAHPSDGRAAIVALTPQGQAAVDAALADLLADERRFLAALPAADQTGLARLLRTLILALDELDPAG
ncbi:MAG: MarR family transcriptional regulator [Actinomycetia bacterium]|nr:MarR family transcriptional regulator [Actinomycetes bacterium]